MLILETIAEVLGITSLRMEIKRMSAQLDALTSQIAKNTSVTQGAITLIAGLRQQIIDAGTDPAALKALTDSMAKDDDNLAQAIVDNTPAGTPAGVHAAPV